MPTGGQAKDVAPATPGDTAWPAVFVGNDRARRFYAREGWHDRGALGHEAETA